jgi:hypothetical protein
MKMNQLSGILGLGDGEDRFNLLKSLKKEGRIKNEVYSIYYGDEFNFFESVFMIGGFDFKLFEYQSYTEIRTLKN